jgi:hypothetical protein
MPGGSGNVNRRTTDFDVMKGSFAFAFNPLLKARPAANAADSPRSRERL